MNFKIDRLRKGFLPNAQSFQSIVDLRPVYSSGRDEITDLIIVSQFRVVTDSPGDDQVFQISEELIPAFRAAVDLLERKFALLKKQKLLKPPQRSED